MTRRFAFVPLLASAAVVAGCAETTSGPNADPIALAESGGSAACPVSATVVVTDEASLHAALATAAPGSVIGLDGLIELSTDRALVNVDDVTLTCATPGSGLFGTGGAADVILDGSTTLIEVRGDRVSVDHLVLDGRNVITAYVTSGVESTFSYNSVRCGVVCSWFQGAMAPVITDNFYDATDPDVGTFSAIQVQRGAGNAIVHRNEVVGSGNTGIRIRSGVEHDVEHNAVSGDWLRSMVVVPQERDLTGTVVGSNQLEGAVEVGLIIGSEIIFLATGNLVRSNRIAGAGQAGVVVERACGNTFLGNNLNGNAGGVGLVFGTSTGGNTYNGNPNLVVDDGDFDCDGDGVSDPNQISGG